MKASLCVGEYCENAYNVEGLDIRVYSMEELCYCLKENAFLLDLSIMNDKLVDWIGEECKVWELAKQLYPMVHKQGSLSVFVVTILQYVGMYDPEEILQVEQVLKQGAGLSNLEKRKSQIEHLDAYLAAKRMELTEDAYVAFAAQNPENYTESLELEKRIEQFEREWEQQPEYRQLRLRGDWRVNDRVKYDAENERLTQALKNSYRTSVSV